jgi:hypothetical protein
MLAGWIEPRLVPIGQAGTAELAAQHRSLKDEPERKRPLLLYDPKKGRSEFFLLEYRTPFRLGYDNFVGTTGLVIWQIAYGNDGNPVHLTSERENCKHELVKVISVFVRGAPACGSRLRRTTRPIGGSKSPGRRPPRSLPATRDLPQRRPRLNRSKFAPSALPRVKAQRAFRGPTAGFL